jgi:hypothetical protein
MSLINEPVVFDSNQNFIPYYLENGYAQIRINSLDYLNEIDSLFNYYQQSRDGEFAFKNAEGFARHLADIFRDKNSIAMKTYEGPGVKNLTLQILKHMGWSRAIYTHAKLSYKTPFQSTDWFPHQDNGYKLLSKSNLRKGYAILIALEDMHEKNGCFEIFPRSHHFGTFPHKKVVENQVTGDYQAQISDIPSGMKSIFVKAKKGDIVIFSGDAIHQSGSSNTTSKSLALIAEIEPFIGPKLDDYGYPPIFMFGEPAFIELYAMRVISVFNISNFKKFLYKIPFTHKFFKGIKNMLKTRNKF